MMITDPPSTSKCRAQMNRLIVFNKREVNAIFSSHGEVTLRLCKTGHNQLFATAQKSTQAAKSTQEIGQVLRRVAYIQLSLKLCTTSATLSLSLTQMCACKQQALHCGCGHISWFTCNKLTHQSANSGLQMGKGERKTTPSQVYLAEACLVQSCLQIKDFPT